MTPRRRSWSRSLPPRSSPPRARAATTAPATTTTPDASAVDGPDEVDTGRLHRRRHGRQQREDRPARGPRRRVQRVRRGRGQRALHRRAAAQRRVRPRRHADPGGLAEPRGQRRAAGHLVAGRVGVGRHRQRPRRPGAGAAGHAVHADAARHRHAAADGRGARLAGRSSSASPTSCTLAQNPEGWGAVGHPEWGPFRLGKTNPNFSTSGLNFTIAEYYAAVGKTQGLTVEDLARPAAVEFASQIESSVVHYGDITMTFLNNWFAADARGTALTYASVVAVEEKSVIDYNLGNPDGVLSPGEEPRVPRDPLVAIYPEEGTLFSDSPFIVLDTEWVDDDEKAAAAAFETFVQLPGEPAGRCSRTGSGRTTRRCRSPTRSSPTTASTRPSRRPSWRSRRPRCSSASSTRGPQLRKDARVLLVLDISGSMGELVADADGKTRLDLAQDGRDQRARPVQGLRRRRAVGVQHRPRRARPEHPRARADRPDRRPSATPSRRRSPTSSRRTARRCTRSPRRRTRRWSTATTRRRSTPSCC